MDSCLGSFIPEFRRLEQEISNRQDIVLWGCRGVTRHSTTGRFEAHLWDSSWARPRTVSRLHVALSQCQRQATCCTFQPHFRYCNVCVHYPEL